MQVSQEITYITVRICALRTFLGSCRSIQELSRGVLPEPAVHDQVIVGVIVAHDDLASLPRR